MTTLYGIKNCDTVKKARTWLDQQAVDHSFHDFRVDGLTSAQVKDWIKKLGLDLLINKRSTSWKGLDDAARESLDEHSAVDLILANPTLIKRPLLEHNGECHVGFKAAHYQTLFS